MSNQILLEVKLPISIQMLGKLTDMMGTMYDLKELKMREVDGMLQIFKKGGAK